MCTIKSTICDTNTMVTKVTIVQQQADDTFTRYAHCSEVYVSAGEAVQAGQVIAAVGSTGNSTGPHLHLEYIVPGEGGYQYIDPLVLF